VPDDADALAALDRLYVKVQAWPELGEILDRRIQAAMDPAERGELLVRLGALVEGAVELEEFAAVVPDEAAAEQARRSARLARARLN
jgi:hypothetical protein